MRKTAPAVLLLLAAIGMARCGADEPASPPAGAGPASAAAPAAPPEAAPPAPGHSEAAAAAPEPATTTRSRRAQRFEALLKAPPPPPPTARAERQPPRPEPPATSTAADRRTPDAPAADHSAHDPAAHSAHAAAATPPATSEPPAGEPPVDDGSDVVPPVLLSATFEPARVEAGQPTFFSVFASDQRTGVRSVAGIVRSPSGSQQGFSCNREGETNRWVARVPVPEKAPAGRWLVQLLTLTDHAGNRADLNQALGGVPSSAAFDVVSAESDSSGPTLRAVWLERVAMRAGETNRLFVDAADEEAGIAFVHGVFVSPSKSARLGFGCKQGTSGTWECPLAPPACLDCGGWQLELIQIQDRASNSTTFRADHAAVGPVSLELAGDRCDAAAPRVTLVEIDPPVVSSAEESGVSVRVSVTDEGGCGAKSLSAQMVPPDQVGGQRATVVFGPSPDGATFTGRLVIPKLAAKGLWTFAWMEVRDAGLNLRMLGAGEPVLKAATLRVE